MDELVNIYLSSRELYNQILIESKNATVQPLAQVQNEQAEHNYLAVPKFNGYQSFDDPSQINILNENHKSAAGQAVMGDNAMAKSVSNLQDIIHTETILDDHGRRVKRYIYKNF